MINYNFKYSNFLSFLSHSSNLSNLRGSEKSLDLQLVSQKCRWPGDPWCVAGTETRAASWGPQTLTSGVCTNSTQVAPELNCSIPSQGWNGMHAYDGDLASDNTYLLNIISPTVSSFSKSFPLNFQLSCCSKSYHLPCNSVFYKECGVVVVVAAESFMKEKNKIEFLVTH